MHEKSMFVSGLHATYLPVQLVLALTGQHEEHACTQQPVLDKARKSGCCQKWSVSVAPLS